MTMQEFLAGATLKAANDLAEALLRLPEDKRGWSAGEGARTALDQVAECAVLTGYAAETVQTRRFALEMAGTFMDTFWGAKAQAAAQPWDALHAQLTHNAQQMADAIRALPDASLNEEVEMPWRNMMLSELIAYPYWNMTYHMGQINYIASLAGV